MVICSEAESLDKRSQTNGKGEKSLGFSPPFSVMKLSCCRFRQEWINFFKNSTAFEISPSGSSPTSRSIVRKP